MTGMFKPGEFIFAEGLRVHFVDELVELALRFAKVPEVAVMQEFAQLLLLVGGKKALLVSDEERAESTAALQQNHHSVMG